MTDLLTHMMVSSVRAVCRNAKKFDGSLDRPLLRTVAEALLITLEAFPNPSSIFFGLMLSKQSLPKQWMMVLIKIKTAQKE